MLAPAALYFVKLVAFAEPPPTTKNALPYDLWGLISESWKPSLENGVTVFLQGLEKRGPDNRRKRIYMSAVTPDLYRPIGPQEYIITPNTTYIVIGWDDHLRRIFTDGRDWPKDLEPTFSGYSIGRWIDEDGDGRHDALEVETRGFKGPRAVDPAGLPLAVDNQSIFKERFYLDKANPNILHDEMTVIDHALTRPWTVHKKYVRNPDPRPNWPEYYCGEGNAQVLIGKQNYFLSSDGLLMPAHKDQPPPDLRYFNRTQK